MKLNLKPTLGLILGLVSSSLILDLAGFDYNLFRSDFVFWKMIVRLGTPVVCVLHWLLILLGVPKSQNK